MGILALIAEFENDIRRERQMDGIEKARTEPAPVANLSSSLKQSSKSKEGWQDSARDHALS